MNAPRMREGNELLQAVKEYAYEDRGRSWIHLLETWGAMLAALAGTIWAPHWSLRLLCSLMAALVHIRMFILFHDFAHGALLRNSVVATWMMNAYAIFCLSPPNVWRRTHNYHHKHNAKIAGSSIGSYPMMTTADYANASDADRKAYAFARSPLAIA